MEDVRNGKAGDIRRSSVGVEARDYVHHLLARYFVIVFIHCVINALNKSIYVVFLLVGCGKSDLDQRRAVIITVCYLLWSFILVLQNATVVKAWRAQDFYAGDF